MTDKLRSLDAVRGLAAVVVVMHHLVCTFWMEWKAVPTTPGSQVWNHGEFAIRLFFVLSGFVLSLSYFRTLELTVLRSMAVRRYFRLALPIIGSVALAVSLQAMGLFSNARCAEELGLPPGSWLGRSNAGDVNLSDAGREAFFGAYFSYDVRRTYNSVLWTMEMEFKGSLLVFAALALFGRARNRWLLYTLGILVLYKLQHYALIDFIAGMALCDWWIRRPAGRSRHWGALAVLAGLIIGDIEVPWMVEVYGSLPRGHEFTWWFVYVTQMLFPFVGTVGAVAVIVGVLESERIDRFLSRGPFRLLGKMSFSLYLVHLIVIFTVGTGVFLALVPSGLDPTLCALVASVASVAVSFALAAVGAKTLDPWSIRLGRVVDEWLFEPRVVAEGQLEADHAKGGSIRRPFGVTRV